MHVSWVMIMSQYQTCIWFKVDLIVSQKFCKCIVLHFQTLTQGGVGSKLTLADLWSNVT